MPRLDRCTMITLLLVLVALALCGLAYAPQLCGWGVFSASVVSLQAYEDMEAGGLSWANLDASLGVSRPRPVVPRRTRPVRGRRPRPVPCTEIVMTHLYRDVAYPFRDRNDGLFGVLASGVPPCKCPRSLGFWPIPNGIDAMRRPLPTGSGYGLPCTGNF